MTVALLRQVLHGAASCASEPSAPTQPCLRVLLLASQCGARLPSPAVEMSCLLAQQGVGLLLANTSSDRAHERAGGPRPTHPLTPSGQHRVEHMSRAWTVGFFPGLLFIYFLRFYLFIHERQTQRERQRHKQAPCRELDLGLDPRSPGSGLGLKAGAQPLGHPGCPSRAFKLDQG